MVDHHKSWSIIVRFDHKSDNHLWSSSSIPPLPFCRVARAAVRPVGGLLGRQPSGALLGRRRGRKAGGSRGGPGRNAGSGGVARAPCRTRPQGPQGQRRRNRSFQVRHLVMARDCCVLQSGGGAARRPGAQTQHPSCTLALRAAKGMAADAATNSRLHAAHHY